MHAEAARQRPAQRVGHQPRPEVGTADADADDVGDLARLQRRDQPAHAFARLHGDPVRLARRRRRRQVAAQRGVQRGAPLGDVDLLAVEQAPERAGEVALPPQTEQRRPGRVVVALAGEVRVQRPDLQGVAGHPSRFALQQPGDAGALQALRVGLERVEPGCGSAHQAACLGML